MRNNSTYRRTRTSLIKLGALLGAAGAAGIWFWLSRRGGTPGWAAPAILGPAAVLGILYQLRARAARRLRAALDAFAEREMAQARRGNSSKTTRTVSARGSVLQSRRPAKPVHLHS